MAKLLGQIFSDEVCENIIRTTTGLSDQVVTFSGEVTERLIVNNKWSDVPFNFYRFSQHEAQPYLDLLKPHVPPGTQFSSMRVMHYPAGACIGQHQDGWSECDGESDSGLIVRLNDKFTGGRLFFGGRLIHLAKGEGVLYHYSELHEVKPVKTGERWIVNFRFMGAGND